MLFLLFVSDFEDLMSDMRFMQQKARSNMSFKAAAGSFFFFVFFFVFYFFFCP